MFSELMKRSNAIWLYSTGRFAEERRTFLCDLVEHGHGGVHTLRQTNRLLLAIAERLNVQQRMPITERQIEQAARDWVSKTRSATCSDATRSTSTKRFIFVAKQWLQFLGKLHEPDSDSPFKPQLDSFLAELRDQRGYSPDTISTRRSALHLFFE
jgi:integrase/recombinase XerD